MYPYVLLKLLPSRQLTALLKVVSHSQWEFRNSDALSQISFLPGTSIPREAAKRQLHPYSAGTHNWYGVREYIYSGARTHMAYLIITVKLAPPSGILRAYLTNFGIFWNTYVAVYSESQSHVSTYVHQQLCHQSCQRQACLLIRWPGRAICEWTAAQGCGVLIWTYLWTDIR